MASEEDPQTPNVENMNVSEYSKLWKELINGLSEFTEFQDTTTPIAIISVVNLLVGDYAMQKRNSGILTKLMDSKVADIEVRKKTEETLRAKITHLNNIIRDNDGRHNEVVLSDQIKYLENKCNRLKEDNKQLSKTLSEGCEKCEVLRKRCDILELENAQYMKEISCRHDGLMQLQNRLQNVEPPRYPAEFEDQWKQLKTENKLLKEQLALCHNLTVEMQQKYLKPVDDLADKLKTIQGRCNTLELENKQLNTALSCKYDAEFSLKQKDLEIEELKKTIKEMEVNWEHHSCVVQTKEGLNQLELDNKEIQNKNFDVANADKLKDLNARIASIQSEIKQLEGQMLKRKEELTDQPSSSHFVFDNANAIQIRNDQLEVKNNELTIQLQELNKKLIENNVVQEMLHGKLSCSASEEEDESLFDRTVTLKQKDERRTYGVWFRRKRGPLTSRESKFYIDKINNNSLEAQVLQVGDYVIMLNGVNVQQASSAMVNHILKSSYHTELTMVVRSCVREYEPKTICGGGSVGNDWGITLGVFVKNIYCDSFARKLGLHEYDEILKIDGFNLENVALGFALDIINSLQKKEAVRVILEKTHYEIYKEKINKLPHDCFHVKALVDYNGPYSFKHDDIFCITNSHFIEEQSSAVKWEATVTGSYGRNLAVIIPSQRAKIIIIQEEPKYNYWRKTQKRKSDMYYEILDDVDIAYSDMGDLVMS